MVYTKKIIKLSTYVHIYLYIPKIIPSFKSPWLMHGTRCEYLIYIVTEKIMKNGWLSAVYSDFWS